MRKSLTQTQRARKTDLQRARRKADPARAAAYTRAAYWRDPEKARLRVTAAYAATPETERREINRRRNIAKRYGITVEQHDALYAAQGGRCGLCDAAIVQWDKHTHVDHDHATGVVRGLLCRFCNIFMALPDRLGIETIAAYMRRGKSF